MRIASMMIAAVLVALNVVGAAAQPPMGDGLAHEQMMGIMQQMSVMMGQMAEMLRSGDLTPEHRVKMADVMAQMAQVMRQTTRIMGSQPLGFQTMSETGKVMQEMGRIMQQMAPLMPPQPVTPQAPRQR